MKSKFGFKRLLITIVVTCFSLVIIDIIYIISGKHSIEFDQANECYWFFKNKQNVDNEFNVAFVGKNDTFYKYQYADSLRICIWKFSNISNMYKLVTEKNIPDNFEENKDVETYNFDSFILKYKLRLNLKKAIHFEISQKCRPSLYIKGHNYMGMISVFNQINISDNKPKASIYYTQDKPTIFLILKQEKYVYAILVEGMRNIKVNKSTLKIFSFVDSI